MQTLTLGKNNTVLTVRINRPDVRNAFNETVIAELREVFASLDNDLRAVVLTGTDEVFCAGADINWMRASISFTEKENARDAGAMAQMYRLIDEAAIPVIGRINGHAFGGGVGLVACCDIAIAVDRAKLGFTEARLGIVPAVISTFSLRKIGVANARRYFLTGEIFTADIAKEIGLLHEVVGEQELDGRIEEIIESILTCGPNAVKTGKRLIREISGMSTDNALEHCVRATAQARTSREGQEGLGAFLDKRKPSWMSIK